MPLIDRRTGEGLRVMASVYELLLSNLIFTYMYAHTCHIPNTDARSATCKLYALRYSAVRSHQGQKAYNRQARTLGGLHSICMKLLRYDGRYAEQLKQLDT